MTSQPLPLVNLSIAVSLYISLHLEKPIHYDLLLFGLISFIYCILFVAKGKYFIEFMGSWVRTITSPFRKAYTIFNPAHHREQKAKSGIV
jgi:hypothetical protein